jgi:hypothetical protein
MLCVFRYFFLNSRKTSDCNFTKVKKAYFFQNFTSNERFFATIFITQKQTLRWADMKPQKECPQYTKYSKKDNIFAQNLMLYATETICRNLHR